MPERNKVNKKNGEASRDNARHGVADCGKTLRRLCFEKGFDDVAGLARRIKKHRVTVHRAWKNPKQYGPTFADMVEALGL